MPPLAELFPALRDDTFTHAWGGSLGIGRDWHASVGLDTGTSIGGAGGGATVCAAELAATWARYQVWIGDTCITEVQSRDDALRSSVYGSLYRLAEWVADKWWPLTAEPRRLALPADAWIWRNVATPRLLRPAEADVVAGGRVGAPDLTSPRRLRRRLPEHMSEREPSCVCHADYVDPSAWRLVVDEQRLPQEVRQLTYEPNPKHKPVPIPGRHGSICPPDADGPTLLQQSVQFGRKRYATDGSRVYCAHQHDEARNAWHGYPIDWAETPPTLIRQWIAEERVTRRTVHRGRRRATQWP